MPCNQCGSYQDACPCVARQQALDDMRALGMRTVYPDIAILVRSTVHDYAAIDRAQRESEYEAR